RRRIPRPGTPRTERKRSLAAWTPPRRILGRRVPLSTRRHGCRRRSTSLSLYRPERPGRRSRIDHVGLHRGNLTPGYIGRQGGVHDVEVQVVVLRAEGDPRRVLPLLHVSHHLQQELADGDDLAVAHAQVLILAVRDGP